MKTNSITRFFAATIAAVLVGGVLAPVASFAQTSKEKARQRDKNTTRNVTVGAGAVAAHEAIKGRRTSALLAGAGALYAGKKYEDARKAQRKDNGTYKVYKYKKGKKIGYYQYVDNKRTGYHKLRG